MQQKKTQSIKSVKNGNLLTGTDNILTELEDFHEKLYNDEKVESIAKCNVLMNFSKRTEEALTLSDKRLSKANVTLTMEKPRKKASPRDKGLNSES